MEAKQPKRILIFSHTYFPFVGGAEIALKEITDRFSSEDFVLDMIALGYSKKLPREEKIGNINLHRIGFTGECDDIKNTGKFPLVLNKFLMPVTGFFKAYQLHRENNYDMTWVMIASYNSFPALIFKKAFPKVPMVLTLQEGDPLDYIKKKTKIVAPFFKAVFTNANVIQVISNYLADFAKEMGAKGEVIVIPNGVDIERFSNKDEDKITEIQNKYKKQKEDIWLITTSRLVKKNAVSDVIYSMGELPDNIKFLILGEGPLEDDLKNIVEELRLDERIKFLGQVEHKDLPSYLHASDIFIRPSLSEGFGVSFVESMAAKIPVIATDVGGIKDFLKHEETGLVCGVRDSSDIAHKVLMLTKDQELRDYVVENAFKMVEEKYDWNNVTNQMAGLFKNVVPARCPLKL